METTANTTINTLPEYFILIEDKAYYNDYQKYTCSFTVADFKAYFPKEYHNTSIKIAVSLISQYL